MTLGELRRGLAMAREHDTLAWDYEGRIRTLTRDAGSLHEDDLTNTQTYAENAYWHHKIAHEIRYTLRQVHHA